MDLFRCSNCHCLISYEYLSCPYCGSKVTIQSETIKETKRFKPQKFNLIIGILMLLIAICRATFAYFSATTRNIENDVTVKSAYVSIQYDGETEIIATNLIAITE